MVFRDILENSVTLAAMAVMARVKLSRMASAAHLTLKKLIFASKNFRQTKKMGLEKNFRPLKFSPTPISDAAGRRLKQNFRQIRCWRKFHVAKICPFRVSAPFQQTAVHGKSASPVILTT
jgi:hypothetical protein